MAKKSLAKKMKPPAGLKILFHSKMVDWAAGMHYCEIPVPAAVTKKLGTKAAVLVMAQVNNSEPFKVSLFPAGGGQHFIRVRKKVREASNLKEGDSVDVSLRVLDRASDAILPDDLKKTLRSEGFLKSFGTIPPGAVNYLIRRVEAVAKSETRLKRIDEAVQAARERAKKTK